MKKKKEEVLGLSIPHEGCGFRIASNTTVAIDAGEVVCSNSAETARRFRKNSDIAVEKVRKLANV